ncbi:hypothetical protein L596_011240 [Steinernema carpocapsae]|uniref:EF-hand domain-containing protein n=1 Tax=Steinernema carpocapsae TaxID=34508 RepID=A0A4U5NT99_STECR|nr:hypothetical protein L596_011240 [Steinernema carpocapsae]
MSSELELDLNGHHDESDFFVAAVLESFDQFKNGTVDFSDVGNVIRCLNLCPSEAEVSELVGQLENSKNSENRVNAEHLMSRALSAIENKEWVPPSDALLQAAFETLAIEEPLTKSRLHHFMMTYALEKFRYIVV